jgi:hypothetical protein
MLRLSRQSCKRSWAIDLCYEKVTRIDLDIDATLIDFSNWSISYVDFNGDGIYGLQDPVYLHDRNHGNQIVLGDIRLTLFESYFPGTKVMNYNTDANSLSFDLMGINTNNSTSRVVGIRFFNRNGNYHHLKGSPIYDSADAVYLHIIEHAQWVE